MRVFVQGGASTPSELLTLFWKENPDTSVELMHLHLMGDPLSGLGRAGPRRTQFFVGSELRKSTDYDHIDYLPCFLSEIPRLLRDGPKKPDLALIQVSPLNTEGFCSLGPNVDIARCHRHSPAHLGADQSAGSRSFWRWVYFSFKIRASHSRRSATH